VFRNPTTRAIVDFLTAIGLDVIDRPLTGPSFLDGILLEKGKIYFDEEKLLYPGDLLHEAGHLAVAPGDIRPLLSDEVEVPNVNMDAIEAGAMAWSYAAALHIGLDPAIVFHEGGYKGKSEHLLLSFRCGVGVGVNILEQSMMTLSPGNPHAGGRQRYPHMLKWLRD
jgi:hypothetical protein